jgi:hypothetical protein
VDAGGKPYPDRQGTLLDELKFLRGWAHGARQALALTGCGPVTGMN